MSHGQTEGTSTTDQSRTPAPWLEQASQRGVGYSEDLFNRGYQSYTGQRVAGLSDNEKQASALAQQDRYTPWFNKSGEAYGRAGELSQRTADQNLERYINPYTKNVLDVANKELGLSYEQQQNKLRSQAASRGAFGGSRQSLLEAQGQKNFMDSQQGLYATGMSGAYDRALAANQSDIDRAWQGALAEGQGYGQLGVNTANMTNDQIRALMATGETERSIHQGGLDSQYEEFLRSINMPREDLDRFLASLRAGDYSQTGGSGTTSEGSNTLLGLGWGIL